MHPLNELFKWFPNSDFAVLDHGFLPHGRDYALVAETSMGTEPGRHQLQFTHVVEMSYLTALDQEAWSKSWGEEFVNYEDWTAAGEPEGYVWGTDWSLAWPGLSAVEPSVRAKSWSDRLSMPMFEARIGTGRFELCLVFHGLRTAKISDETSTVSQAVISLEGGKS
jgi:hypothetical protein